VNFRHCFQLYAPLNAVADFHSRSESMAAITPPFVPLSTLDAPARLDAGDQMSFKMWLGFVPIRWRAQVTQVSGTGFSDHQMEGPFRYWIHRHTFALVDAHQTEVIDEIKAGLRWHPLWGPIGLAMWVGLPVLFAYRAWKTRRILETERV
jgi:ligand-binding SRPBCC domain-containing protein